jgi:hypothetical protein
MTPRARLVTALEGTDFEQVMTLLHNHKIEKVCWSTNPMNLPA